MKYQYSEKDLEKIEETQHQREVLKKYGVSFCTAEDMTYPRELLNGKGRPPVLYYKGDIEILNQFKNIAVIGGRKISETGRHLAYQTAQKIGEAGINIVNGLALGCDTEAIRGALNVGARCVVILPCGLEQVVPKVNRDLAGEILEKGGCILSEYPIGTKIEKYRYIERDRLQSGISQGVFVVEAEEGSGTMHTVDFALRQYKRLACYSYKMTELSSGNKYLESTGKAQIISNQTDVENYIGKIMEEKSYEQLSFL